MLFRSLLLSLILGLAVAPNLQAFCSLVEHVRTSQPNWTLHEFFKPKSTEPLLVEVVVREPVIEGKIEFWADGRWERLKPHAWVTTNRVRITPTSQAVIGYRYLDCGDIIEAEDK
jgi:hypothetical protein